MSAKIETPAISLVGEAEELVNSCFGADFLALKVECCSQQCILRVEILLEDCYKKCRTALLYSFRIDER